MKKVRIFFHCLLVGFVLLLFFISFNYDAKSAFFPLLSAGVTIVLGVAALITELYPPLRPYFETRVFQIDLPEKEIELIPRNFLILTLWLVMLAVLIFFFGFLWSLVIWSFLYVIFYGRHSWQSALFVSFLLWIFVYGFFVKIMGLDLFKGVIFGGMT